MVSPDCRSARSAICSAAVLHIPHFAPLRTSAPACWSSAPPLALRHLHRHLPFGHRFQPPAGRTGFIGLNDAAHLAEGAATRRAAEEPAANKSGAAVGAAAKALRRKSAIAPPCGERAPPKFFLLRQLKLPLHRAPTSVTPRSVKAERRSARAGAARIFWVSCS